MAGIEAFKGYERTARIQVPEENYGKGMQYTNAPIGMGYSRILLNYDVKDNGELITPRPGLIVSDLILPPVDAANQIYTDTITLIEGRENVEEDSVKYKQFILGDKISNKLYAITTSEKGTFLQTLTSSARFKDVKIPQIHNIIPGDMPWAFQHTGTFAYNNTYYYFDDSGLCHTKFDTDHYIHEAIVPKELTPKEAVMWGYNMLKTNPYNFSNTMLTFEGPIQLLGVLPYDADNNLVMTPQVNQTLHFECFYKGREARVYTVVWEWKEPGASNWTQIKTEDITIAADKKFLCEFSAPNNAIMLKLTATNKADDIDTQVLTIGFDFGKGVQGNGANAQQKIYDLRQATSMTYWKNRLVAAYKNLLFVGEVNDPSYFPYPNNLEPFQEDIIHVLGYLDNLLVFTSSQLHVITLGTDGLTWYVRTIQSNLNIQPCDVPLIRVVKNMVFFKSGNYYYMVVPKASSTTGELTIAPVSRPIENLFDHFKEVIADILKKVYDYTDDFTLVHCHNFLDFEDVHNIYTFQTSKDVFVNIAVLYNTIDRSWRFYLYESKHILKSFKQDATMKGMFMGLVPMGGRPGIQLLRFNNINCVDDYYYPEQAAHELFFKNYQMLDTGYRDIFTNIKKRFREFQLKLYNRSYRTLGFHTEFYIDGDMRQTFYKYTIHHEIDPENVNYGLITMERELNDPSILPGVTILAENSTEYDFWQLDVSQFPELAMWKIRVPVSGKGFAPRLVLVSYNQEPYDMLNHIWVFRQLYSR